MVRVFIFELILTFARIAIHFKSLWSRNLHLLIITRDFSDCFTQAFEASTHIGTRVCFSFSIVIAKDSLSVMFLLDLNALKAIQIRYQNLQHT